MNHAQVRIATLIAFYTNGADRDQVVPVFLWEQGPKSGKRRLVFCGYAIFLVMAHDTQGQSWTRKWLAVADGIAQAEVAAHLTNFVFVPIPIGLNDEATQTRLTNPRWTPSALPPLAKKAKWR